MENIKLVIYRFTEFLCSHLIENLQPAVMGKLPCRVNRETKTNTVEVKTLRALVVQKT
jgi:hypothetical protein